MLEENEIKISVILPVYNAEKYIEKCIRSILNQTLRHIEIIVINDGSNDNSIAIINEIAECDKRIKIIDIPNGGVSKARNLGITLAKGKFISFVDSDDWLEPKMLELLYKTADEKNADIVKCDMFLETNISTNKLKYNFNLPKTIDKVEAFKRLFIERGETHFGHTHSKIYKSSLIIENNLLFAEDMNYSEDILFLISSLLHAKTIAYYPQQLYHYNLSSDSSLTRGYIKNLNEKMDLLFERVTLILKRANIYNLVQSEYSIYQFYAVQAQLINIMNSPLCNNLEKFKGIRQILKKSLIKYPILKKIIMSEVSGKSKYLAFLVKRNFYNLSTLLFFVNYIITSKKRK